MVVMRQMLFVIVFSGNFAQFNVFLFGVSMDNIEKIFDEVHQFFWHKNIVLSLEIGFEEIIYFGFVKKHRYFGLVFMDAFDFFWIENTDGLREQSG